MIALQTGAVHRFIARIHVVFKYLLGLFDQTALWESCTKGLRLLPGSCGTFLERTSRHFRGVPVSAQAGVPEGAMEDKHTTPPVNLQGQPHRGQVTPRSKSLPTWENIPVEFSP
jgi:hypothetical protein